MPSCRLEFSPDRDREVFAVAPAAPAVFALFGKEGGEPYITRTANLRRRLIRILGAPVETGLVPSPAAPAGPEETGQAPSLRSRRLNLRERVGSIEYWPVGSDFEAQFVLYRLLRKHFPDRYRDRLRLRPAPLVKFDLENQYPRAYVTTRLGRLNGRSVYYGPFSSRIAAEKFLNDSLDLFRIRRCPDDLHPDPAFPGCIYSEMKMCLAPCFAGCSDEQYGDEVRRVQQYLDSRGDSLQRELEAERDRASAELQFESAATLHARIMKAHEAAGQMPDLARRLDQLNGVMVQPSSAADCVRFFRIEQGAIGEGLDFPVHANAPEMAAGGSGRKQPVSMDARISEALNSAPPLSKFSAAELADHLALLKRWFFRTHKTGELFLTERRGEQQEPELPMRRVVRGVSRVFGERQAVTAPAAAEKPRPGKTGQNGAPTAPTGRENS